MKLRNAPDRMYRTPARRWLRRLCGFLSLLPCLTGFALGIPSGAKPAAPNADSKAYTEAISTRRHLAEAIERLFRERAELRNGAEQPSEFIDVPTSASFRSAVTLVAKSGVMEGVPGPRGPRFLPDRPPNRFHTAVVLHRLYCRLKRIPEPTCSAEDSLTGMENLGILVRSESYGGTELMKKRQVDNALGRIQQLCPP